MHNGDATDDTSRLATAQAVTPSPSWSAPDQRIEARPTRRPVRATAVRKIGLSRAFGGLVENWPRMSNAVLTAACNVEDGPRLLMALGRADA